MTNSVDSTDKARAAAPPSIAAFLASRRERPMAPVGEVAVLPLPVASAVQSCAEDYIGHTERADANNAKIMIVDDASTSVQMMQIFLEDAGYSNFVTTDRSVEAMAMLVAERPDVLLLDLNMPEVSGFDILAEVRANSDLQHIPILILTAADDAATKLRVLELGATDFLAKPVDTSELALRLRNTLAAKAHQDRLTHYDSLTDLPNRSLFLDRLGDCVARAQRNEHSGALLHIDLDRFRHLNDSIGHGAGDRLLRSIARRLVACVRDADEICRGESGDALFSASRFGGDEFVILLPLMRDPHNAELVAERIREAISEPIVQDDAELIVTPSIGIVNFPAHGDSVEVLLRNVGLATARAKQLGRDRYEVYSAQCDERATDQLGFENDLRRALENNELQLLFQPKVSLATGRVKGAEALLRWHHPERGMVSPVEFIPVAEETGLIVPFGSWVLREACEELARWHAAGWRDLGVAVNVASLQLKDGKLVGVVRETLEATGVNPNSLTLELTESSVFENTQATIETLAEIRALGVRLSLDDFGTGYSSLSYLEHLPIDELKIDRSFIAKVDAERVDAPIVSAIIAMARRLGLHVVAEGVETEVQREYLERQWCDTFQGYLFAKPLPAEEFVARVRAAGHLAADEDRGEAATHAIFGSSGVATGEFPVATRVLVIDDQPSIGDLIVTMLADEGIAVSVAQTGADGLALARTERFDLVLLDVGLPDTDGFAVCEKLCADPRTCHLPVVFLTAREAPEDESRGLNAGARDFVRKPVHREILRLRVRNQIELERHRNRAVSSECATPTF